MWLLSEWWGPDHVRCRPWERRVKMVDFAREGNIKDNPRVSRLTVLCLIVIKCNETRNTESRTILRWKFGPTYVIFETYVRQPVNYKLWANGKSYNYLFFLIIYHFSLNIFQLCFILWYIIYYTEQSVISSVWTGSFVTVK